MQSNDPMGLPEVQFRWTDEAKREAEFVFTDKSGRSWTEQAIEFEPGCWRAVDSGHEIHYS